MNEIPNSEISTSKAAEVGVSKPALSRVAKWISSRRKRIAVVVVLGMMAAIANESGKTSSEGVDLFGGFSSEADTSAEKADDFFASGDLEAAPEFSGAVTGDGDNAQQFSGNGQELPDAVDAVPSKLTTPHSAQEAAPKLPPLIVGHEQGDSAVNSSAMTEPPQGHNFQVPAAPASWEVSGDHHSGNEQHSGAAAKPVRFRGTIVPVK